MKWLLLAALLVSTVWFLSGREGEQLSTPTAPDMGHEPRKGSEPAPQAEELISASPSTYQDVAPEPDAGRVINIGKQMDPDDPATWSQPKNSEVINIGEPIDPDDPTTWSQPENTEVINIGEPIDPDDPFNWPQPENTEVINIGEPIDTEDPWNWLQPENTEVINLGEPMDPDDQST